MKEHPYGRIPDNLLTNRNKKSLILPHGSWLTALRHKIAVFWPTLPENTESSPCDHLFIACKPSSAGISHVLINNHPQLIDDSLHSVFFFLKTHLISELQKKLKLIFIPMWSLAACFYLPDILCFNRIIQTCEPGSVYPLVYASITSLA